MIPIINANSPPREEPLEFKSRGWIHGYEILGAQSRGAKIHILRESGEPCEEARQWSVQEQSLGHGAGGEAVALLCKRKGLFGSETDAAIAIKSSKDGRVRLSEGSGALLDKGGSWVPRTSLAQQPQEPEPEQGEPGCPIQAESAEHMARMEQAWSDISEMPSESLEALRDALSDLIGSRAAERESLRAKLSDLLAARLAPRAGQGAPAEPGPIHAA